MTTVTRGIVLCAVLGVVGCGTDVSYTPVSAPPSGLESRAGNDVEILAEFPERPYRELGYLEAQQESVYSTDDSAAMLEKLRQEAGEKGCDAVVVLYRERTPEPTPLATGRDVMQVAITQASCIVYSE